MHTSEESLVSLYLINEGLVCSTHVLHLFVDQLLHLDHFFVILLRHVVKIVVQNLQSLRECLNPTRCLVLQVTQASDILENLILLVLKVLIETLDVCECVLDFDVDLSHTLLMLLMLSFDLSDCHIHEFCRSSSSV